MRSQTVWTIFTVSESYTVTCVVYVLRMFVGVLQSFITTSQANILIDATLSVKLSDFGLAKFSDASAASLEAHTSAALRWMAPEILSGSPATFASDVYSFGCVCSEVRISLL